MDNLRYVIELESELQQTMKFFDKGEMGIIDKAKVAALFAGRSFGLMTYDPESAAALKQLAMKHFDEGLAIGMEDFAAHMTKKHGKDKSKWPMRKGYLTENGDVKVGLNS